MKLSRQIYQTFLSAAILLTVCIGSVYGEKSPADQSIEAEIGSVGTEVKDASSAVAPWRKEEATATTIILPGVGAQEESGGVPVAEVSVAAGGVEVAEHKQDTGPAMAARSEPRELPQLLSQTQRGVFEVWGTSYNAIQAVTELAQALESIVGSHLLYIDAFPQPIWIQVVNDRTRTSEPFFQIHASPEGNIGLRVFWNEHTRIESVANGLSWALLQRIAQWRWGQADESSVPHWLSSGLALEVLVRAQPARNQGLSFELWEDRAFLPLPLLINARQGGVMWSEEQTEAARLQSLWFYRLLRDKLPNRQDFGKLLEAMLQDRNAMAVLGRAFGDDVRDLGSAQQWWEVGAMDLVHRQRGMVYSLAQSERIVRSLSSVVAWQDGRDQRLSGMALWEVREGLRWQSALWYQQREVKLELQRINPVYFNALLSLGQFYDLLLEKGGPVQDDPAEVKKLAAETYTHFVEDFAYAQALRSAVDSAMDSVP